MRSSLKQETLRTTTEGKPNSDLLFNKKSYLFNHIDKLAADHNVTVSNTMIKVTYKKALKDHYDNGIKSVLIENKINMSEVCKKKGGDALNLCNSDISIVPSFVKSPSVATTKPMFHSTINQQTVAAEKKSNCINRLDLTFKQNCKNNSIVNLSKVQHTSMNKVNDSLTPLAVISRKKSLNSGKTNDRFPKDISSVKVKDSIIISKDDDAVNKPEKVQIEVRKLENGVKSKTKGRSNEKTETLGRKSQTNPNLVTRKIKSGENKSKEGEGSHKKFEESNKSGGNKKAIMMVDPELPSGWTRFIRTKNKGSANEQHVVYVVSPQGKKFRFKWKLRKFLETTNSSLDADQFFFGLYNRPKSSNGPPSVRDGSRGQGRSRKTQVTPVHKISLKGSSRRSHVLSESKDQYASGETGKNSGKLLGADGKELLLFDPDLPFGWKRIIHSNTSTGRLQVHIISPEGRIFRRRYRLHEYLMKHQYTHNLDRFYFGLYPKREGNGTETEDGKSVNKSDDGNDYDEETCSSDSEDDAESKEFISPELDMPNPSFAVFGESKRPASPEPSFTFGAKKKFSDKPVPPLDIEALKDVKTTPEGNMINTVAGLMMSCGLSSARSERRLRVPRDQHGKALRDHLNGEVKEEVSDEGCQISKNWVQRIIKCRSDFRVLEPDAVWTVAEKTKEFIKELSRRALAGSENPEEGLRYEDVADVVNGLECLSPLQTLIPRKISYREYVRLNRPKQFLSFT